jgi:23S rRNA pseudouridine1911/1915/1917 synthase
MSSDLRLQIHVDAREKAGVRIDRALADELKKRAPHLSRATLKHCFVEKSVRLGPAGHAVSASTILLPGTHEVTLADWDEKEHFEAPRARPAPEGPFLPIVFEDESFLVLNKAPGVPSVPHSPAETQTAVSSALASCPDLRDVGFGGLEPGLLHRLDNGTSGLLVFAKNGESFHRLRESWKNGLVKKIYRAKVASEETAPALIPGELRWLLAHDEKSAKRMIAFPDGIRASSRYRGTPLETLTRIIQLHTSTDVEIEIVTGVMHQIRCVLGALGHPILGDPLYGGAISTRLWLHAWRLEIPREDGSTLSLEAPLPARW